VNYIGLKITSAGNKFVLDVFDKRKDFPFSVIRYPHALSALPRRMAENVFIGQLHRFYFICSQRHSFIKAAVTLTQAFLGRGYSLKRLCKLFINFCRKPLRFRSTPFMVLVRKFKMKIRGLKSDGLRGES